jgi:hypothetical protein
MSRKYSKEDYKDLKKFAKECGIRFASMETTFEGIGYNGISVAYRDSIYSPECRMVEVAVSYCAPEDNFKNKHGKFQALSKFINGETVQLPLAEYRRDYGSKELESLLFTTFSV